MSSLFPDTHPAVEAVLISLLRETPRWRKLEMVDQLNQSVKLMALTCLRQQYPEENDALLHRRLVGLLLGEDLACNVYGVILSEV